MLEKLVRIRDLARWDSTRWIELNQLESTAHALKAVTFQSRKKYWDSFQWVFVKRIGENSWIPAYEASLSSKGFNTMIIHGFLDQQTLDVDMCVDNCDWWGEYERVQLDIDEWLNIVREEVRLGKSD